MSFLSERKDEIIEFQYDRCCKRALLDGVLFAKAHIYNGVISFNVENLKIANYISGLISEIFQKNAEISTETVGGRCYKVSFSSLSSERYLNSLSESDEPIFSGKCSECRAAFIKGVFLSCGRIVDPHKQYRLEFSPAKRVEKLINFLKANNLVFSFEKRKNENIIYTGNSSVIEDFFTLADMTSTTFILMNLKIESEFKNSANRIRNCETHNIGKSISASAKFVVAIEALERANLLSTLPEELEKTARLRLKYRDYSLARLAGEFSPPISKPGLSHRLNKILDIYNSIEENKQKK